MPHDSQVTSFVGRTGLLRCTARLSARLDIGVEILEVRKLNYRTDVLVRPLEGDGTAWVALTRIDFEWFPSEQLAVHERTRGRSFEHEPTGFKR